MGQYMKSSTEDHTEICHLNWTLSSIPRRTPEDITMVYTVCVN